MKKFLSLVLALVMTMSLVTISAGAKDFTDGDAVKYNEAIDVMSAVKVVEGYPDGSFQPAKTLKRAEAAKIICNLVLGPTTAAALSADTAPFKDVPASHWAAGYIAYCAQQGIINGYGNGVFGPDDTLTGYQFMKMLLTALGYDASVEGYVGGNWSIPVAKQALAIGLDDGNDEFDGNNPVTREEACLYSLNTLTANLVDYDSKTTVIVNGAEVVIGNSKAYELGQGSIYKNNMNKPGLQFAEKYFTDLKLDDSASDDFGRPANTWKVKGTKVGPYPLAADETYNKKVKGESIYEDLGKKVANSDITVFVDGKAVSSNIALVKGNDKKVGARGSLTEVFYDDDAVYYGTEKVVITTVNYFFGEVLGDYDTEDEEVTLAPVDSTVSNIDSWTVSSEDVAGLEGLKDGDKVIFTAAWNTNSSKYDIKSVEVVEPVIAAVTEYTVPKDEDRGDGCVTAGGKEYEYNVTYAANNRTYELKDDYKLYLDPFGNVIFADGVEAEGNYFFVTEYAKNGALTQNAKYEAAVYTLDGVNDVVTLNKVDDVKPTSNNLTFNKWVSFREKTTGKYDITTKTTVGGVFTSGSVPKAIENGKGGMQIPGVGTVRVTNSTIFVINDKNDNVTVYTGIKNVPTIDAATDTAIYAMKDGNYAKFVFVDVNSGHIKGAKNSDIVYFLKATREDNYSQDVDDNTYYTYKAIVNGEEKKVKVEASVSATINAQALYTDIVYSSNKYIDGLVKLDADNTMVTGSAYEDDFMVVSVNDKLVRKGDVLTDDGNTMSIYLADGATATIIKDDGDGIDTVTSARALSSIYKNTALNATIYAVLNADGEATALYVQL